ncbi:MAG: hypothetical protein JOZ11_09050 [Alphaproteobacteria bacterium]|nr:hypothetical protein [Alphaproteobacteria bacterium]
MKEKLVNAALLIASLILALVAFEVGLRAYHGEWEYRNYRSPQDKFTGYHAYDAELGWVPKEQRGDSGGAPVTIVAGGIRSNGGEEVWDGNDEPNLAVGDSFTFGEFVPDSETWPAQLEKLSGTRVINGGVDGYGVDQIFLRARRFLSRYRFSTVIFSFIPDDIRRSQMSVMFVTAKPYFDFKDGRLTLENVPVPPTSHARKESELLIALEHSRLVHTVMQRLSPKWWLAPSEIQVQDREEGIKVACALLHELEGLTKSRGSKLIVLAQHGEVENSWESMASESVLTCLSDPATRVLDLKPALSELKAKDPSRYHRLFYSDGHMTADGNQFVALEIAKILTRR